MDRPQEYGPLVNAFTMPSMLLSGLMLPMTLAPGWLNGLSHLVPFRYLVDAMRDDYLGHYGSNAMLEGGAVRVFCCRTGEGLVPQGGCTVRRRTRDRWAHPAAASAGAALVAAA